MNESQIEWFNDLSTRYMKYNVSLYNYKGIDMSNVEFGEVDFSLKVTKEETEHRYIILSYCGDEKKYDFDSPFYQTFPLSGTPRDRILNEIKDKFISYLDENKNIRVSIYSDFVDYPLLLSTYEEEGKKNNYMYDDFIYSLYYMIRFPKLDYEGYYILMGMIRDFKKIKDKYEMDVSYFPSVNNL